MISLTRSLPLAGSLAILALTVGCQTHDRALYDYQQTPVRSNSVKVQSSPAATGGELAPLDVPPEPGQSGLPAPTLIP